MRALLLSLALLTGVAMSAVPEIPPLAVDPTPVQDTKRLPKATLKAHLLTHFIARSQWPSSVLPKDGSKPFIVGIVGTSPFNNELQALIKKARPYGTTAPVQIKTIDSVEAAIGAHILFLGTGADELRGKVMAAVAGKPILAVGTDDSVHAMFDIAFVDNKIRFIANMDLVRKSGVAISSKLMVLNTARPKTP